MKKLHVGCGDRYFDGYEHLDKYVNLPFIDYKCDVKDIPVKDNTYDEIFARHWLEHLYYYDAVDVLRVLKNKLKVGGFIHLIVPNLSYHARQLFIEGNSEYVPKSTNFNHAIAGFYGWVKKGKEYMQHKHGYTKESMEDLMAEIGLEIEWNNRRQCDLELKAYKR